MTASKGFDKGKKRKRDEGQSKPSDPHASVPTEEKGLSAKARKRARRKQRLQATMEPQEEISDDGAPAPSDTQPIDETTVPPTTATRPSRVVFPSDFKDTRPPSSKSKVPTDRRLKRAPQRAPTRQTDFYVSRKSKFPALLRRAKVLLNTKQTIHIHGMGAAMRMAVSLALEVSKEYRGRVVQTVTTSTVPLLDDIEPDDDDDDLTVEERMNSAVHIEMRLLDQDVTSRMA